jgi:hypothetical protein
MIIETAVRNYLIATAGVTNLTGQHIYYNVAPQDVAKPFVVITKIAGVREKTQTKAMAFCHGLIQISIFDTTYLGAKAVATAIQTIMQSYSGTMGTSGGITGADVGACFYDNEIDFYEQDTGLHHIACDYSIDYEE